MLPDDDSVSLNEPTYSTEGLDKEALKLERQIFLKSELGQKLFKLLVRSLPKGTAGNEFIDTKPFDKVTVYREEFIHGWVIKGLIGKTVYSLAVTDLELQYSNAV